MAEDSNLEKSEPATSRRLDQARERGQVPRSPELSTFAILVTSSAALMIFGTALVHSLEAIMRDAFSLDRNAAFEPSQMWERLVDGFSAALMGLSPLFMVVVVVGLVTPMLVSGWVFSIEALQPDFSKLNLFSGIGRLFSTRGVIELGKAIVKSVLIGGVAVWVIWSNRIEMLALITEPIDPALAHMAQLISHTFLIMTGAFALIVVIDVPFQIWDFARQMRMTKEEVRQESKETEGNPQTKGRVRSMQREQARRRMMAQVPKADVIVTNPTHYAVALQYQDQSMRAPRVIAKGALLVAERIAEIGQSSGVPTLRAPELARALFAHAEIGRDIPAPLYNAVAEVLAWVYQLRAAQAGGTESPQPPTQLAVPANLDPGPAEA